ncbi:MAG: hypothetical protein QOJ19_2751 [Acidimicrobiia bacterium]|nr:hypothetical protein [Acidimicrobiia bacterium]
MAPQMKKNRLTCKKPPPSPGVVGLCPELGSGMMRVTGRWVSSSGMVVLVEGTEEDEAAPAGAAQRTDNEPARTVSHTKTTRNDLGRKKVTGQWCRRSSRFGQAGRSHRAGPPLVAPARASRSIGAVAAARP